MNIKEMFDLYGNFFVPQGPWERDLLREVKIKEGKIVESFF